jgi:uncharacterized protein YjbI with pentapeptide repeats
VLARILTLTAARRLDGERKGMIVRFLSEARLINGTDPKVDLGYADLSHAELAGAILIDAVFAGSNLANASFRHAVLPGTRFDWSDLRGADFTGANDFAPPNAGHGFEHQTVFKYATLVEARFDASRFWEGADFRGADMMRASLRGASLADALFQDACVTGASFRRARLARARLYALGHDVDFSGARVGNAYGRLDRRYGQRRFPAGWQRFGPMWSREGRYRRCLPIANRPKLTSLLALASG